MNRFDPSNQSPSMNGSMIFKKKSMRIDWRKIAGVDIDRIIRDVDINTLQENIDHITFCNIESELVRERIH